MRLKKKLIIAFLAFTCLVVLVGLVNIKKQKHVIDNFYNLVDKDVPKLVILDQIKNSSLRMLVEVSNYALLQSRIERFSYEVNQDRDIAENAEGEYQEISSQACCIVS